MLFTFHVLFICLLVIVRRTTRPTDGYWRGAKKSIIIIAISGTGDDGGWQGNGRKLPTWRTYYLLKCK